MNEKDRLYRACPFYLEFYGPDMPTDQQDL